MITVIAWSFIYIFGVILCYNMQRIEYASENQTYTKGDRLLNICMSLLSLILVIIILITTWVQKINKTGYWNQPVKPVPVAENKQEAQ